MWSALFDPAIQEDFEFLLGLFKTVCRLWQSARKYMHVFSSSLNRMMMVRDTSFGVVTQEHLYYFSCLFKILCTDLGLGFQ